MKRHISIFAFLLCAFAAAGLTGTAEAGTLRTYYKTPEGTFGGPNEDVVSPKTATTPMQTPTDFTAYPGNGEKVEGWYYYSNTPAQRGALLDPAGTGNPLTLKIEDSADRYLYAHFAWITYKVKYDANGGSGAPAESSGNSYKSNFTVSSTVPTKNGYTFAGWKADTSGKTYAKGTVVAGSELCRSEWHDDNQVVTLTAQWTKEQYTISTAVEPTGAGNVTGAGTYDFGTQVMLTATANSGWQFERWKDGGTDNPRTVTVGAAAATYTAVFKQQSVPKPTVTKSFTYDGTEKTCATAGDHYTVTGNTGTNVGEYTFTAKLTDGYAWSDGSTADYTVSWTINAATITGVTLASTSITYDGQPHQPTVASVTANGKTFSSPDTGWTVVYQRNGVETSDFTNAGTITVRVTGTGNLTGSYTAYFTIGTREIRMDEVVFDDLTETYDGTEKTIKASNVPSGVTATYSSNTRTIVGEQQAWVTFKPNDNNHTVSLNQKLATLKIEQATITAIALSGASATYDGQSHKPTIGWVTANNKTFSNVNTGWDVTYLRDGLATGDFTSQGAITVTATGNSNLKGAASATFTINPATIESVTLTSMSATYDGQPHQPTVASVRANGRSFTSASTGWTVACTRNGAATTDFTSAGAITVTVTGKTGLSGTASATFTINPAAISAITLREASATYDGNPHQPAVASVTANGKTFTDAAIGWDVTYDKDDFTSVGNIRVTATGKNNLTGSANATFEIKSKSITVIFDSNGGNAPSPASKTVQCPGTYGTLATCTRKGCDFTGWWTAKEGGTQITETTTVELSASQTLYARWEAKRYTLTIALKEGESYGAYKGPQNYQLPNPLIFGETNLNEIAVAYKKDDADFQGYFTSAGAMVYDAQGRNVKGALGEYWTNNYPIGTYCYDGNLTLSARFADPREHYQVTVTASPAEAGTVDPSGTATYVEGSNIVLTATANTGYSFWHWTKDGAEVSTNSEYPLTVTANAEYVAVFTGNVYTVTFDGQRFFKDLKTKLVSYGQPYGDEPEGFVMDGYKIEGWYTLPYGQGVKKDLAGHVDIPADHTLYANWIEKTEFTGTFIDPSGTNKTVIVERLTKGQPVPSDKVPKFEREGYWFNGWNPALPKTVSGDFTTYAQWLSLADVLDCPDSGLVFTTEGKWEVCVGEPPASAKGGSWMQLNDGSGSSHITTSISEPGTLTFHYKGNNMQVKLTGGMTSEVTLPAATSWTEFSVVIETAVTPVKVDFTCSQTGFKPASLDWVIWEPGSLPTYHKVTFKDPSGTFTNETQSVKDGEPAIVPNWETNKFESLAWDADFSKVVSDLDVNAVWTCRVEFVDLEAGNTPVTNRTEWGGSVSSPTFTPPAGKNFGGWDPAVPEAIASNMTCVAVWTAKPVYTVSYIYEQTTNKVTKTEGDTINLAGETFMRKGYTQKAWSSLEDGSSRDYEFNAPYSVDADLVLYPYWEKDAVVDPIAEALDCPDSGLTFTAVGGWSVFTNAAFAKIPPSCMSNSTAGATLTTKIKGPGTLSFWWKAGSSQFQGTVKLVVKVDESTLYEDGFTGRKTTEWTEVTRRIESSGDDSELSFSCPTMNNGVFCAIDGLVWTPDQKEPEYDDVDTPVTGLSMSDGKLGFVFSGSGSTYHLLGTNDVLAPMPWPMVFETNKASGVILFEIPVKADEPKMFYRIRALK